MNQFFEHLGSIPFRSWALPGILALLLLSGEVLLLTLRLFLLVPADRHHRTWFSFARIFFRGQLMGHFSIPTLGDLYRFNRIQKLTQPPVSVANRIQYLAIERFSETLTLPFVALLFTDLNAVKKMVPQPPLWTLPILILLGVVLFLLYRRRKTSRLALNAVRPKILFIVCLISASGWILDLFALKILTATYSIPLAELMLALIALSMSSLPPLPWGRWGLFEGILGAALHQSGIPIETALALACFFHILMVIPFIVFNLFTWRKK